MKRFEKAMVTRRKKVLSFSFLFFIVLQVGTTQFLYAQQGGAGTTGAVGLEIPVSPRAIAMGQAFVAVADDANSVYWNPAGLRQLGGIHITAEYDQFISTLTYEYIAGGAPVGNDAAVGAAVKILSTGTDPSTTGGTPVGETYMDLDLAGAYRLNYYLDIGLTAKYITESITGENGSTFAVDLGMQYKTPLPHLTAGLDLQNLGPGIKVGGGTADPLPFNVKVGAAYKMFDDNFTMAYDMNFPNDNAISAALGGEYWYQNTLVGRFGYQFQGSIDNNDYGIGGKAGLYLGAGVKVQAFKDFNLGFDYAWTDTGFFGANQHFALDAYF